MTDNSPRIVVDGDGQRAKDAAPAMAMLFADSIASDLLARLVNGDDIESATDSSGGGCASAVAMAMALADNIVDGLQIETGPYHHPAYRHPVHDEKGKEVSPATIYLPGLPVDGLEPETLESLRAFLAHEAFHHRMTTESKAGMSEAMGMVSNGLEDARIDGACLDLFPGAGMNIRHRVARDWIEAQKLDADASPSSVAVALRYVLEGVADEADIRKHWPRVGEALRRIDIDGIDISTEAGQRKSARDICRALGWPVDDDDDDGDAPDGPSPNGPSGDGDGPDGDGEGTGADGDGDGTGPAGGDDGDGDDGDDGASGDGEDGGPLPRGGVTVAPSEKRIAADISKDIADKRASGSAFLPYTQNEETHRRPKKMASWRGVADLDSLRDIATGAMIRLQQALQAPSRAWRKRQRRGSLDTSRLADVVAGERDIMQHRASLPGLNTAVAISVDLSGSMSSDLPLMRDALLVLSEALGRIDIPTSIAGWDAPQWHGCRHYDIKRFGEAWDDGKVIRRICGIYAHGSTPTANGLFRALEALRTRQEKRRVLLLITDGCPDSAAGLPEMVRSCDAERIDLFVLGITYYGHDDDAFGSRVVEIKSAADVRDVAVDFIARAIMARSV
jgi:hypothetical protein